MLICTAGIEIITSDFKGFYLFFSFLIDHLNLTKTAVQHEN